MGDVREIATPTRDFLERAIAAGPAQPETEEQR